MLVNEHLSQPVQKCKKKKNSGIWSCYGKSDLSLVLIFLNGEQIFSNNFLYIYNRIYGLFQCKTFVRCIHVQVYRIKIIFLLKKYL